MKCNLTQTFKENLTRHQYFCETLFFNSAILKPMATPFQNTLTFDQYFFSVSLGLICMWNSMHLKKAISPPFSGQTPHFLGEMQKIKTNNLHQWRGDMKIYVQLCFQKRIFPTFNKTANLATLLWGFRCM